MTESEATDEESSGEDDFLGLDEHQFNLTVRFLEAKYPDASQDKIRFYMEKVLNDFKDVMTVGDFQDKICAAYEKGENDSNISDDDTIENAIDAAMEEVFSPNVPVLVLRPSAKQTKKASYFSDIDDVDLYAPEPKPKMSIEDIMRPFKNASSNELLEMDYSSRYFVQKILQTIPVDEKSYDFASLLEHSGTFNQVVYQFQKHQHPDESFPELLFCIRQVMHFGNSHKEKRYLKPHRIQEIVTQALQFQQDAWKLRGLKPDEKKENETILNTILETMKNSLICFNKSFITKLATEYFDYWRRNKELPNDMLKKAELQKDLLEATQLYFKSLRKTSAYHDIPLLF